MSKPPLGFRSVATEPFRKLVESTLSKSAADNVGVRSQNNKDNLKASNFPITTFTVGNWKVYLHTNTTFLQSMILEYKKSSVLGRCILTSKAT